MDKIIHEMSRIYSMFCWPRAVINEQTREVVFEHVWKNSDAETYYNTLAEILKTQQAAQHRVILAPAADAAQDDDSGHHSPLLDVPDLASIYPAYYTRTVDVSHSRTDLAARCDECAGWMKLPIDFCLTVMV